MLLYRVILCRDVIGDVELMVWFMWMFGFIICVIWIFGFNKILLFIIGFI